MPEDTLQQKIKTDRVPYERWVKEKWITTTSGAVIDYRAMKNYVIDRAKKEGWYIREWCVDPWGAIQISGDLVDLGETVIDVVQGIKTLSEPTKDFVYKGASITGDKSSGKASVLLPFLKNALMVCQ